MNLQIRLKKGLGDFDFGCKPTDISAVLGPPSETDELESPCDGATESIVWYYPDAGLNFFFDSMNGEPALCTVESNNPETLLFGELLFNMTRFEIEESMKRNGYHEIDEDDETWGEHRITFEDAQVDFYFSDSDISLVSWSCI